MERMVILVSPEQKQAISARARGEKLPVGEMVRRAVVQYQPQEDTAALERLLETVKASTAEAEIELEKARREVDATLAYFAAKFPKAA